MSSVPGEPHVPTLSQLNSLSPDEARDFFLTCCGSTRWADSMAACRPYWDIQVIFNAADVIWEYLAAEDRREALRSRDALSGGDLSPSLRDDLDLYREKFGYGFVVALPLPPGEELQAAVRRRLEYSLRAEFDLASSEEFAIMRNELRRRLTA